jgi:hypothetical protein
MRNESLYGCPDHPGVMTLNKRLCPSIHYTPEQAKAHARALLADLRRNYPNHKPGDPIPDRYL